MPILEKACVWELTPPYCLLAPLCLEHRGVGMAALNQFGSEWGVGWANISEQRLGGGVGWANAFHASDQSSQEWKVGGLWVPLPAGRIFFKRFQMGVFWVQTLGQYSTHMHAQLWVLLWSSCWRGLCNLKACMLSSLSQQEISLCSLVLTRWNRLLHKAANCLLFFSSFLESWLSVLAAVAHKDQFPSERLYLHPANHPRPDFDNSPASPHLFSRHHHKSVIF